MKKPVLLIEGNVAEVIEDKVNRHIKIVCQQKHIMFSIEDMNEIQLGDHVELEGELKIGKIKLNGIEISV